MKLQEADAFYPLLFIGGSDSLDKVLEESNFESALSVGFRHGYPLYVLYHQYGLKRLKGIDLASSSQLVDDLNENFPPLNGIEKYNSIFDFYTKNFSIGDDCPIPKITSKTEFESIFDLELDCGETNYFRKNTESFDLIINSNTLHFDRHPTDAENNIRAMSELLNPNGIFYIRVKEKPVGKIYRLFEFEKYEEWIQKYFLDKNLRVLVHEKKASEGSAMTFTNIEE